MKKLTIVRHAKSSWDNPNLKDINRPLNRRGFKDADLMSNAILEKGLIPDLIVSSPANRALTTAKIFAAKFNIDTDEIIIEQDIYFTGLKPIINIIEGINDKIEHLMLFGHQPYMAALHSYFVGDNMHHLPTTGVSHINFEIDNWQSVMQNLGTSIFVWYPKMFK